MWPSAARFDYTSIQVYIVARWIGMKTATLGEIKRELTHLTPGKLIETCLRMAKYKKENKELLSFLLFHASEETTYIEEVKGSVKEMFEAMPKHNNYLLTKGLRRILRYTNRYIKYSASKSVEADLLIYFLKNMKELGIKIQHNAMLSKLYEVQVKKVKKAIESLHEDLQYDFEQELAKL